MLLPLFRNRFLLGQFSERGASYSKIISSILCNCLHRKLQLHSRFVLRNCLNEVRSFFVNKFWGMKKILRPGNLSSKLQRLRTTIFSKLNSSHRYGSLCSKERYFATFGHISQFVCYMLAFLFIEHHSNTSISLV